jgi:predicted RNase H-like nuclease
MTKTEIIQLFGTAREVARFFKITDAAVSAWDCVPEIREIQLEKRRPDLYDQYARNLKRKRS